VKNLPGALKEQKSKEKYLDELLKSLGSAASNRHGVIPPNLLDTFNRVHAEYVDFVLQIHLEVRLHYIYKELNETFKKNADLLTQLNIKGKLEDLNKDVQSLYDMMENENVIKRPFYDGKKFLSSFVDVVRMAKKEKENAMKELTQHHGIILIINQWLINLFLFTKT
jgi:arsenate reductase-like glutaredoxin family protein